MEAIVEPMRLFAELSGDRNNQRPDILLGNPRDFGRQIILDVALTGVNGQSRTSDDLPDRPLQVRYDQKIVKYGRIAKNHGLQFVPAIFLIMVKFTVFSSVLLVSRFVKS